MDKDKANIKDGAGADLPVTAPANSNAGAEAVCDEGAHAWTGIDEAIASDEEESGGEDDDENYDMDGRDSGPGDTRDFASTDTAHDEAAEARTRLHDVCGKDSEGVMTVQMPELSFEARETWVGPNNLIQTDDAITNVTQAARHVDAADQAPYQNSAAFDGQDSPYLTSGWSYFCNDQTVTRGEGMSYTAHGMSVFPIFPSQPLYTFFSFLFFKKNKIKH